MSCYEERQSYELCLYDTSKPSLETAMRAIIETRSGVDQILMMGSHPLGRGISAWMRLTIQPSRLPQFQERLGERGRVRTIAPLSVSGEGREGGE